jgi:hypothetical protein
VRSKARPSRRDKRAQEVPSETEPQAVDEAPQLGRPKKIAIGVALGLLFLGFVISAWTSKRERDPLNNFYTDHLRYRYCATLVLKNPIQATTTPLEQLAKQDNSRFPAVTWNAEPCHQAGVVHVLVHAPFQWLLERGWMKPWHATDLYVTLMLALTCVSLFLVFTSANWWAGFFFAPDLLRCSLNGLQEPLPVLLGLIGFSLYAKGRRLAATTFITLAVVEYSRYVIWLPPLAWLCLKDRKEFFPELVNAWRRWRGRALILGMILMSGWSLVAMYLVSIHRPLPTPIVPGRVAWVVLLTYGALWLGYFFYRWRSPMAPFMLMTIAFFCLYKGQQNYWYPLAALSLIPLARTGFEKAMWGLWLAVVAPLFLHLYQNGDIVDFPARMFR